MATLDEAHSTRGRANVLRLAMTGRLARGRPRRSRRCTTVLDLCLECRACKSECPVGVDVGRYKSEFLADYWQRHGTPLKARAFGHVDELAAWGSRFAPIVERASPAALSDDGWPNRCWASTAAALPPHVGPAHACVRSRTGVARARTPAPRHAVLFADTFTSHVEPEIGVAAFEVLDARRDRRGAGAARVLRPAADLAGPAGRGARPRGRATSQRLLPARVAGQRRSSSWSRAVSRPIREDAPDLLRGIAAREGAASSPRHSVLFEEYLEREVAAGRATLPLAGGPSRPCCCTCTVTSARWASAPRRAALLRRIPGADGHRSRCRLLRHGRLVRLHPRALRRVARDRRAEAAAGGARAAAPTRCWPPRARRAGTRWRTSPACRRTHPAVLDPIAPRGVASSMNLAWISLIALPPRSR